MDLKASKNAKSLVSQVLILEVPILPIKTISQLDQNWQRGKELASRVIRKDGSMINLSLKG